MLTITADKMKRAIPRPYAIDGNREELAELAHVINKALMSSTYSTEFSLGICKSSEPKPLHVSGRPHPWKGRLFRRRSAG